jgi:hypothetical protein
MEEQMIIMQNTYTTLTEEIITGSKRLLFTPNQRDTDTEKQFKRWLAFKSVQAPA